MNESTRETTRERKRKGEKEIQETFGRRILIFKGEVR